MPLTNYLDEISKDLRNSVYFTLIVTRLVGRGTVEKRLFQFGLRVNGPN